MDKGNLERLNMRKEFFEALHAEMNQNKDIVFLCGDVGYGLADKIKADYPDRFYNVGAAEMVLITSAVGLALSNKIPVCYTITPFLIDRPFEAIKLYLNHEQIPVKLVGSGRRTDYEADGVSHWEHNTMDVLPKIVNLNQFADVDMTEAVNRMIYNGKPTFISLKR